MVRIVTGLLVLAGLFAGCKKDRLSADMSETIYIRHEGADMPVYIYGNGLAKVFIVILHGGPGGNGLEYRSGKYYKAMEEKYAMVYWDQRGQGASQGSYTAEAITVDKMVEDVRQLLLVLKGRYGNDLDIFLMGHSWGGTLGTAFMIKEDYQQELTGWIEVSGAHDIPMLNKAAIRMFIQIGEDEVGKGHNTDAWQPILEFARSVDTNRITIDQGASINEHGFTAEELIADINPGTSSIGLFRHIFFSPTNPLTSWLSGNHTSDLLNQEVENLAMTNDLDKIHIPSLFIWGKYDFVVPPHLAYSAFDRVSSATKELVIFEHSGHSPMDNQPDLFVEEVSDFIDRVR